MNILPPVDYERHQHQVYAQARAIDGGMLARWMAEFAIDAPTTRPLSVLDLGSGTGRFTPALANTFGGPVYGVEPSGRMRAQAEIDANHPAVRYIEGSASTIPLNDSAVDLVLMFLSFHHFPDKALAAREVARVLRTGGRVLLRGEFSDRPPGVWWSPYFPNFETVSRLLFPSLAETVEVFAKAGLREIVLRTVEEQYSASEQEAIARLKLRGISVFDHLDEAEIVTGFAAVDSDFEAGRLRVPLTGQSDLLVFGP
jgi:ubiquinone/menaquinone biosynthesis C-methylase UbiE